jgi:hypothetical protein
MHKAIQIARLAIFNGAPTADMNKDGRGWVLSQPAVCIMHASLETLTDL